MNATTLTHLLLKSFSEKDISQGHFDISVTPISDSYGAVTFEHKATKQKYDCKFVALTTIPDEPKVYITVVMTKGKFWFGAKRNLPTAQIPAYPFD